MTEALNECEYKIPNHFVYSRDVSKEGRTDIKDSLLAKDVIWYCQNIMVIILTMMTSFRIRIL